MWLAAKQEGRLGASRLTLPLSRPFPPPSRRSIFAALGHPGTQSQWAGIESLRHWRDNTGGCRQPKPEHGSVNLKQLLWENSPLLRCVLRRRGCAVPSCGSALLAARLPAGLLARSAAARMKTPHPPPPAAAPPSLPHRRAFAKPDSLLDLLLGMLTLDPSQRLTAAAALQHEWFKQEPLPNGDSVFAGAMGRQAPAYPQRAVRPCQ